jgi:RNA polymerase sigma factor (TIGR02999 family)
MTPWMFDTLAACGIMMAMNEVTRALDQMQQGDRHAAADLLPLVYDELRRLAAAQLAGEKPGQTLDATALVHEAYLRLVGAHHFADRRHFFVVAAEAMRRILIDRARTRRRAKRGGGRQPISLDHVDVAAEDATEELLALDEVLNQFTTVDPVKAELVKLRYFAGLSEADTAAALGISRATASRYWTFARAWLINALDEKTTNPDRS